LVFGAKDGRLAFDKAALDTLKGEEQPQRRLQPVLGRQRPDIAGKYWQGMLWSPCYFTASCGGASFSILRQYIEQLKKQD
jgi:REP element-mobilizing transposase RayT